MEKARRAGLDVPQVYKVDTTSYLIVMEYVEGQMAKDYLIQECRSSECHGEGTSRDRLLVIANMIGKAIGGLHSTRIIHGDLTTSNMIIGNNGHRLTLIDFGLASHSNKAEDRAVDLYVLERAITSTHADLAQELFAYIMEAYYQSAPSIAESVKNKLAEVQRRGRKRDMTG